MHADTLAKPAGAGNVALALARAEKLRAAVSAPNKHNMPLDEGAPEADSMALALAPAPALPPAARPLPGDPVRGEARGDADTLPHFGTVAESMS